LRAESCCRYPAQSLLSENPGERFSRWIFGSDLDGVIVKEGDPNGQNAKDTDARRNFRAEPLGRKS
jgi:hypothetical protein